MVGLLEKEPGYILIAYGKTTIELSVWTGIGLVLAGFFLLFVLSRSWRSTRRLPRKVGRWMDGRSLRASHKRTNRGLIAYTEGRWEPARKSLAQVAERSDAPLVYYLLAARASHALGEDKEQQKYLSKAEQTASGADLAVGLTQAEFQLERGQLEQALATLMRVRAVSSSHPVALKLLAETYEGLNDWPHLRKLIPDLRRAGVLSSDQLQLLERRVYVSLLEEVAANSGKAGKDNVELEKTWKLLPKELVDDVDMQSLYAGLLVQAGAHQQAGKFIRKELSKSWDDKLVYWYGLVRSADLPRQLQSAEDWLKDYPNSAELLLCLGRLSLANQSPAEAQKYFESSLELNKKPETCIELGRLLASQGKPEASIDYFQQALQITNPGLPQLPGPETVATPPSGGQQAAG
jgi:HemY protein